MATLITEKIFDPELITEKPIDPKRCVLAFGIPTKKEDFWKYLEHPKKDFAKKFYKKYSRESYTRKTNESLVWKEYHNQIIFHLDIVKPKITNFGTEVHDELTLSGFGKLFQDNKFDVIILFSHWKEDAVEFDDGLAKTDAILEQVPKEFSGIIDLCVCNPKNLRIQLDLLRPNCIVKFSEQNIKIPFFWLYFYQELFRYLEQNKTNYLEAVDTILDTFSDMFSQKRRKRKYEEKFKERIQSLFEKNRV